ncbi:MAG: peptidoglycan DD-metalloendopeptidase family protein [Acidobacteria bacterium]|nr:peptidoglycan DD-metalloendopeptidase family protein [Acidobacteriota bacterium]
MARLRKQEKSLLGEVERLELEERLRTEELREIRLLLERTHAHMDRIVRRARDLERSVDQTRPVLAARARALYKLGELSYLRLLLSVERPSDFFRGYRYVTALARRDNQRMAAFRGDLAALATTRAELETRTQEALALRAGLERARRNLEADRKRKTELLTQIVGKKETHAAYLQELEEAEAKLRQLLLGLAEGEVAVPIAAFRGTLAWPAAGRVRVPFGRRKHPKFDTYTVQNGMEIEAPSDAPVAAVHEGTVVFADRFRGYGLMVVLDHGGKHHSLYAHLGETTVKPGRRVLAGETVGTVGVAGLEGGPGLYFEMRFQGRPEDPGDWLKRPEK